ncbi:PilZ domain-containing protein [Roseitalea porphyridii]|uniref:PilZ domain-containing protein n=1 Tax=Roseitalea porphyridii TaxID=1852022 RepID=A0A4P6UZ26_9HYPH|nr:PilZ domain-containing protein [Roseitalea porphyridii]QBK30025.1 PilZ domain-containing protein [Roseitalea porphyridii]
MADPPSDDFGDTDNEHKRATRRQRVLKQGFAQENPQTSAIACVIRDLSDTGARLKFEAMAIIPERFILHIPVDGIQIDCARRWIRGQECGVAFTSEPSPTALAKHQVVTPIGPAADGGERAAGDRAAPGSSTDAPREPTPQRPHHHGPRRPGFGRR